MRRWVGGDRGGSLLGRMYGRCGVGLPATPHVRGESAVGRAEGTARSPARALWPRHPPPPSPFVVNRLRHRALATLGR